MNYVLDDIAVETIEGVAHIRGLTQRGRDWLSVNVPPGRRLPDGTRLFTPAYARLVANAAEADGLIVA